MTFLKRKKAREEAIKLIYQVEIQKEQPQAVLDLYKQFNNVDDNSFSYINNVVCGSFEKKEELNEKIIANLKGWTLERISRISYAAILLALYEISYCEDVPPSVAINEAVELTKLYDGEESASFVNGILGAIIKEDGK